MRNSAISSQELNGPDLNPILVIDDSARICSVLVSGIVRSCQESQVDCHIYESGRFGILETVPFNFSQTPSENKAVLIYTANSPKHALPVLRLPKLKRLTVICDICMPMDTEVGMTGLLRELALLQLPVNLVFVSSDSQNREYISQLIDHHKAYFLPKGSETWAHLPYALVGKSHLFSYRLIEAGDYDNGRCEQLLELRTPHVKPLAPVIPAPLMARPARSQPISKPKFSISALLQRLYYSLFKTPSGEVSYSHFPNK